MAAAVVTSLGLEDAGPFLISTNDLSSMTDGQAEDVAHGGPTKAVPFLVTTEWVVNPTTPKACNIAHIVASDSATNSTVRITVSATTMGSAVVRVKCWFRKHAVQDGTSMDNGFVA